LWEGGRGSGAKKNLESSRRGADRRGVWGKHRGSDGSHTLLKQGKNKLSVKGNKGKERDLQKYKNPLLSESTGLKGKGKGSEDAQS